MNKKNSIICLTAGIVAVLSLCMLIPASTAVGGTSVPVFADHPVKEQFTGKPALPDSKSAPDVKKFTSRIREGARQGPNFSGHFTIVDWGCGTECQSFVIVDAKTGAIYSPPFTSSWGLLYKQDSNLLIVNPLIPDVMAAGPPPEWLVSRYYTWDGKKLTQIAENRTATIDPRTGAASGPVEQKKLTIIEYYNMTVKADYKMIKQVDGKWQVMAGKMVSLKVADLANGYLEFEDDTYEDGHGIETTSVALFLTADRQPMLAVLSAGRAPVLPNPECPGLAYGLQTFRWAAPDNSYAADDVLPALPLKLFLKKGFVPKKSDLFEFPGMHLRIGYRLPRKGTTVEAFLDASDIACKIATESSVRPASEIAEMEEFLQNVRKDPIKLKWNKATGRFEVQADR